MDVNEHERLSYITLQTQIKVKEQLVVRKDMDVNEHRQRMRTSRRIRRYRTETENENL